MSSLTYHWCLTPGVFVNKKTGIPLTLSTSLSIGPQFTGTVREWYETFVETLIDLRNTLQKEARGTLKSCTVKCDRDMGCILESTVLYKPDEKKPSDRGVLCPNIDVEFDQKCPRFRFQMKTKFITRTGSTITREGAVVISKFIPENGR